MYNVSLKGLVKVLTVGSREFDVMDSDPGQAKGCTGITSALGTFPGHSLKILAIDLLTLYFLIISSQLPLTSKGFRRFTGNRCLKK